jgi:lysophospholipase
MFSANSHDAEFLHFLQYSDKLQSRKIPRDWILAMIDYYKRFDKAPPLDQKLEIIQGTDDGTVDWEKNIPKIVAKFAGSKVYEIKGARHHLVKESVPYRAQVFQFLNQILELESN